MKYFTAPQTAKLVRKILKESFPDMKFSVRSQSYTTGGTSLAITWTDGPNEAQVKGCVNHLRSGYRDSLIDYSGNVYHMMNGETVCFAADMISYNRKFSETAVCKAIASVSRHYSRNFGYQLTGVTADDYLKGKLWDHRVRNCPEHSFQLNCVQTDIRSALSKYSDRLNVRKSNTALTIFITHDDGYSRVHGSGQSAINI